MQLMFKSAIFCTLLLFLIYIEQVLSLPSLPGYDIWDDNGENFLNSSVRNQTDSVRDAKGNHQNIVLDKKNVSCFVL